MLSPYGDRNPSVKAEFLKSSSPPWTLIFLISLTAYLLLVRALRYRAMKACEKLFGYTTRESLGKMTFEDASAIHLELVGMEFPFMFHNATAFALFRTYGIPSVSSLLAATGELTSLHTAAKRYVDTTVLVFEFGGNAPMSARCLEAIARMNYIHSVYQKAGKISNDDMLYTLSLFAGEPSKWVSRYEWRSLTAMELAALGTFWKGIGEAMNIDFSCLPSHKAGWKDGIHWLEETLIWSEEYERANMVPHANNHKLACATIDMLLWAVPRRLKPIGYLLVGTLMDDRLRKAMILDAPAPIWFLFTKTLLALRRILLQHLALPRPNILRARYISRTANEYGRFNLRIYAGAPIYVKPSFASRMSLQAWLFWALGKPIPGDGGDLYCPKGYKISEIGPKSMVGKGLDTTESVREKLLQRGGCPFRM